MVHERVIKAVLDAVEYVEESDYEGVGRSYAVVLGPEETVLGHVRVGESGRWREVLDIDWCFSEHDAREEATKALIQAVHRQLVRATERERAITEAAHRAGAFGGER